MIKTSGLRKSFRTRSGRHTVSVDAVKSVDLAIAEGEVFGFLGPNGAGKTTTLRMLATLIEPDGGEAIIAGADLRGDPAGVRRRIGYVAQSGGTWDDVSAREELAMQARMHGFAKSEALRRAQAAVTAFGLGGYADRRCKTYSGGQRRRLDIALGVIHRPKVLFLDEPAAGLDPPSRAQVWDEVRRLRGEGMDGLRHHALPGGGRRAGGPHRDHRPGLDRRRGHAGRPQAGDRRRRGHGRGERVDAPLAAVAVAWSARLFARSLR